MLSVDVGSGVRILFIYPLNLDVETRLTFFVRVPEEDFPYLSWTPAKHDLL